MSENQNEPLVVESYPQIEPCLETIGCIYIPVKEPYEAAHWYIKNFGLVIAGYSRPLIPGKDVVSLRTVSGPNLFLIQTSETKTMGFLNKDGFHQPAVCFFVKDIVTIFERLKENNVRFADEELKDRGSCGVEFAIFDPDGNKFVLSQQQ